MKLKLMTLTHALRRFGFRISLRQPGDFVRGLAKKPQGREKGSGPATAIKLPGPVRQKIASFSISYQSLLHTSAL